MRRSRNSAAATTCLTTSRAGSVSERVAENFPSNPPIALARTPPRPLLFVAPRGVRGAQTGPREAQMPTRQIYERRFDEDVSTDDTTTCPECEGLIRTNTVETVCDDCGLVVDDQRIDHGPEWRSFDNERSTRERTGSPLSVRRHDRGLSSEVGRKRDANGNTLSGRKREHLKRLRREHNRGRFQSKADRNLATGLGEVQRIASAVDLPDSICDQACQLFRSAQKADLLRGRSIEAMTAACVYGVCRCTGVSHTLSDVARVARVAQSRVRSSYTALNTDLSLPTKPLPPSEYVPRLASDLECPDSVQQRARRLANQAENAGVTNGVHPAGFAAACLYKAGRKEGRWLTQSEVAGAANSSTTTIRNHRDTLQQLDDEHRVGTKSDTEKRAASAKSRD